MATNPAKKYLEVALQEEMCKMFSSEFEGIDIRELTPFVAVMRMIKLECAYSNPQLYKMLIAVLHDYNPALGWQHRQMTIKYIHMLLEKSPELADYLASILPPAVTSPSAVTTPTHALHVLRVSKPGDKATDTVPPEGSTHMAGGSKAKQDLKYYNCTTPAVSAYLANLGVPSKFSVQAPQRPPVPQTWSWPTTNQSVQTLSMAAARPSVAAGLPLPPGSSTVQLLPGSRLVIRSQEGKEVMLAGSATRIQRLPNATVTHVTVPIGNTKTSQVTNMATSKGTTVPVTIVTTSITANKVTSPIATTCVSSPVKVKGPFPVLATRGLTPVIVTKVTTPATTTKIGTTSVPVTKVTAPFTITNVTSLKASPCMPSLTATTSPGNVKDSSTAVPKKPNRKQQLYDKQQRLFKATEHIKEQKKMPMMVTTVSPVVQKTDVKAPTQPPPIITPTTTGRKRSSFPYSQHLTISYSPHPTAPFTATGSDTKDMGNESPEDPLVGLQHSIDTSHVKEEPEEAPTSVQEGSVSSTSVHVSVGTDADIGDHDDEVVSQEESQASSLADSYLDDEAMVLKYIFQRPRLLMGKSSSSSSSSQMETEEVSPSLYAQSVSDQGTSDIESKASTHEVELVQPPLQMPQRMEQPQWQYKSWQKVELPPFENLVEGAVKRKRKRKPASESRKKKVKE